MSWRAAYAVIGLLGVLSALTLMIYVPRDPGFAGGSVRRELAGLRNGAPWGRSILTSIAMASLFAVYTFVGPLITDVARLSLGLTPIGLLDVGIGIAIGNQVGGRIADRSTLLGMRCGFISTGVWLLILATMAHVPAVLFRSLFAIGFCMMVAAPSVA